MLFIAYKLKVITNMLSNRYYKISSMKKKIKKRKFFIGLK